SGGLSRGSGGAAAAPQASPRPAAAERASRAGSPHPSPFGSRPARDTPEAPSPRGSQPSARASGEAAEGARPAMRGAWPRPPPSPAPAAPARAAGSRPAPQPSAAVGSGRPARALGQRVFENPVPQEPPRGVPTGARLQEPPRSAGEEND